MLLLFLLLLFLPVIIKAFVVQDDKPLKLLYLFNTLNIVLAAFLKFVYFKNV